MDIVLVSLPFALAAVCALAMGAAIQRGATCTVAAVDEIMTKRRCTRLAAMLEASLWVAGGLLLAHALHALPDLPTRHAAGINTLAGGVLLGLGAWVNRACVFGAVARFGSGEWAYLATPVGFYLGCVSLAWVGIAPAMHVDHASILVAATPWLAVLAVALLCTRVAWALAAQARAGDRTWRALAARAWSPHAATIAIGITFCVLLLAVGAWAYTDALAELAHGMQRNSSARLLLFAALLAGAALGGYAAGRFRPSRVHGRQLLRCTAGGMLMGWGSLLIPGSNDGLILIGLPLLLPFAWLAFATMLVTIAAAMAATRALARRGRGVAAAESAP